jgi:hypothetical protein
MAAQHDERPLLRGLLWALVIAMPLLITWAVLALS